MNILIVDDEALARSRLRTLLSDCADTLRTNENPSRIKIADRVILER